MSTKIKNFKIMSTKQHVQIPDALGVEIKKDGDKTTIIQHLKPFDKLVYAFMKKTMDAKTRQTFASISKISESLNVRRNTVSESVKKLCACGAIKKLSEKIGRANKYEFLPNFKGFEMFTYDFLDDNQTLTTNEKAIVLALQEFTYKDSETGDSFTAHSTEKLAQIMNVSPTTLRKTFKGLQDKGVLETTLIRKTDTTTGCNSVLKRIDNHKIAQAILFIGKQVVENTNDITELKQIIQELRLEQKKTNERLRNIEIENEILKKENQRFLNNDLPTSFDFESKESD